jgi:hypothetical protein
MNKETKLHLMETMDKTLTENTASLLVASLNTDGSVAIVTHGPNLHFAWMLFCLENFLRNRVTVLHATANEQQEYPDGVVN